MARLPQIGGDNGNWGQILNDYLSIEHNADGTLKKAPDIMQAKLDATQALSDAATAASTAQSAQTTADAKYTKPGPGIPAGDLTTATQASLAKADNSVQSVNTKFPSGGNVTLTASDVGAIPTSQKGAASGIASLDSSSKLTATQLPTSVVTKSVSSGDTGKAIDAYTGNPLSIATAAGTVNKARMKSARVLQVGDSIAIAGSIAAERIAGVPGLLYPQNILAWASLYSGGKLLCDGSTGVGGMPSGQPTPPAAQATSTVRDQVPIVLAMNPLPGAVIIESVNDPTWGLTAAQSLANVQWIAEQFEVAGILPVISTPHPNNSYATSALYAQHTKAVIGRRRLAAERGWPLVDYFAVCSSNAGISYASGLSGDGIHPNEAGAKLSGAEVARVLGPYLPDATFAVATPGSGDTTFTITNPLNVDSNADGRPDNWTAQFGTPTKSVVVDTAVAQYGSVYRFRRNANNPTDQYLGIPIVAGHRYLFSYKVALVITGTGQNSISLVTTDGKRHLATLWMYTSASPTGSAFSCEFTVPATNSDSTPTDSTAQINITTTATTGNGIDLGQLTLIDLTAAGLA